MEKITSEKWLDILGNAHRRQILRLLSNKSMYPQEIARYLGITPRAVMKHLQALEEHKIVTREEIKREEGGRGYLLFTLAQNAYIALEISNPTYFRVKYGQAKCHRKWHNQKVDKPLTASLDEFTNQITTDIRSSVKEVSRIHQEIDKLDEKRLSLMRKREESFNQIYTLFQDKNIANLIIVLYRGLLDHYGFKKSWGRKEIMNIIKVDYDIADFLIEILEKKLQLIQFDENSGPRYPTWHLKKVQDAANFDYT